MLKDMGHNLLHNLGAKLGMYHELLSFITPGVKPYSETQRVRLSPHPQPHLGPELQLWPSNVPTRTHP